MNIGVKLQRINTENFIWLIYFFFFFADLISNEYEKHYLKTGDLKGQKIFKTLNITVFCVAFFIYLYFVITNYENIEQLKQTSTKKEVISAHLNLIASLLFLVAGGISLYAEINKDDLDTDIGLV